LNLLSVNNNAFEILKVVVKNSDELGLKVSKLKNGTTIIDAGIDAPGGLRAGVIISQLSLGGLSEVRLTEELYDDLSLNSIYVATDLPHIAVLCSQYPLFGEYAVEVDGYSPLVSGPFRALMREPKEIFEKIKYRDNAKVGSLILQADEYPKEKYVEHVAKKGGISPKNLHLIMMPTQCIARSVDVAARVIETSMWRLTQVLGYDFRKVKFMTGLAPIAPIYPDIWKRLGITPDDMDHFCGHVSFGVNPAKDDDLEALAKNMVVESTAANGKPFFEILKEHDLSFHNIPREIYAVAKATIYDLKTGRMYRAGKLNVPLIKKLTSLN
jgi:methenyltetrahydromethanopterin cyclohydrolase